MRKWKLVENDIYWTTYHTLEDCLWKLCVKLDRFDCLSMDGEFIETYFKMTDQWYTKRFEFKIFCPPTILKVVKMDKGDINREAFLNVFEDVKRRYKNERDKT